MKTGYWILIAAILLLLFLFEELYRYIFCRPTSALISLFENSKGHEPNYYLVRDAAAERLRNTPCEEYTIRSARGEKLKGYYYPCGAGGRKIVFLIHGYRSEHLETGGLFYDYYKSRDIDFFCCDHTASGQSEGHFIGFDVLETQDCLLWIEFLREKFGNDVQIILHGFSMGGATVLQMSSHCPSNVRFIIADSAYQSARTSMVRKVGPLYQPLRLINRMAAGYDWNDSDVTASLRSAHVPILFVQGQDDKLVPFTNGPTLYELYQGEKDCFFPLKTRHIESIYTHPEGYAEKEDSFIAKYLDA